MPTVIMIFDNKVSIAEGEEAIKFHDNVDKLEKEVKRLGGENSFDKNPIAWHQLAKTTIRE